MRADSKPEQEVAAVCGLRSSRPSLKGRGEGFDIASLDARDLNDLRSRWRMLYGTEPLSRLSRELLIRAIAYRVQEQARGGLSKKLLRKLEAGAHHHNPGAGGATASVRPRFGTRLLREWQGRVHEITVGDDDYLWDGRSYRSLSEIARKITGTRWSGPRFFGLTDQNGEGDSAND